MTVQGTLFLGDAAVGLAATMTIDEQGGYRLAYVADDAPCEVDGDVRDLRITSRLANIPRVFSFENGWQFETADNDGVDAHINRLGLQRKAGLIARFENSPGMALVALLCLFVSAYLFVQEGIPRLAARVADALPDSVAQQISGNTMDLLDKVVFAPSSLDQQATLRLAVYTQKMVKYAPEPVNVSLLFRRNDKIGANAFALPSGQIVVTDGMYHLAKSEDELLAVIAHEIGHVVKKHGLRQVIENSAVAMVAFSLTGDVNGIIQSSTALPFFLLQRKYSRDFELEADRYAIDLMKRAGIDPRNYGNILRRLEETSNGQEASNFLSTHPSTEERIKLLGQ